MNKTKGIIGVPLMLVLLGIGGYMLFGGRMQVGGDKGSSVTRSESSSSQPPLALSLADLQKGDVASLAGSWVTEDGQSLSDQDRQNWLEDKLSQFTLKDGYLVNAGRRAGDKGILLLPAGVVGPKLSSPSLSTSFLTLSSVDRLVVAGIEPVIYYRDQHVEQVRQSNQSFQLLSTLMQLVNQYREDVNQTLADQTDHLARDFTATSPSSPDIQSSLLEQAKSGVTSYDSYTLEVRDLHRSGDQVQFSLIASVTTHYGEDRPRMEETLPQTYKAKKVNGKWYLESIVTEK